MKKIILSLLVSLTLLSCNNWFKEQKNWVNTNFDDINEPLVYSFISKDQLVLRYLTDSVVLCNYKIINQKLIFEKEGNNKYLEYNIAELKGNLLLKNKNDTLFLKPLANFNGREADKLDSLIIDDQRFYWNYCKTNNELRNINIQFISNQDCIVEYLNKDTSTAIYQLGAWEIFEKVIGNKVYTFLKIITNYDEVIFLQGIKNNVLTGCTLGVKGLSGVELKRKENISRIDLTGEWTLIDSNNLSAQSNNVPYKLEFSDQNYCLYFKQPLSKSKDYFRFGYYNMFLSDKIIVLDFLKNNNYGDIIKVNNCTKDQLTISYFEKYSNIPLEFTYSNSSSLPLSERSMPKN